jgi:hypothetical protein
VISDERGRPLRRYPLAAFRRVGPAPLSLEDVVGRSGVHAQVVRQFVALSVVDAQRDASGRLWFDSRAPALVARAQRLRADLGLNYAALGLVLDLLDRIDRLEAALRRGGRYGKERSPWI